MAEKNCRTCVDSTPAPDGTWRCEKFALQVNREDQRYGCRDHLTIPSLINMQVAAVDEAARSITYQAADGRVFVDAAQPVPAGGAA